MLAWPSGQEPFASSQQKMRTKGAPSRRQLAVYSITKNSCRDQSKVLPKDHARTQEKSGESAPSIST
jgi:hypothetical protein